MDAQSRLGDQYFELPEFFEQLGFQRGDESCATTATKIQCSQHNHPIGIDLCPFSPLATEGEPALLRSEPVELAEKTLFDRIIFLRRYCFAIIVGQREVEVVTSRWSSHAFSLAVGHSASQQA